MRAVAALRLVLAASALAVVAIDPPNPEQHVTATYGVLSLYTLASSILYVGSLGSGTPSESRLRWTPWVDVAFYLVLLALTDASSVFFMLFYFPILVAAFRSGFAAGMTLTIGSVAGVSAISFFELRAPDPQVNRLLMRAISLLVIGFVISSRGGFETLLRGRLALLKEIGRLSNPRLGTDRTIGASLERLRSFCDADDCLLVLADASDGEARLRRATRDDPGRARQEDPLPRELARLLLALPPEHALVHPGAAAGAMLGPRVQQYDVVRGQPVAVDLTTAAALAEWFAPSSFITVPVLGRAGTIGRFFLASSGARLRSSDVEFLLQVVDCLLPLLENIRLVDRLAASAAAEERQKIARDVHDSVIQPYIGLELGLVALLRQAEGASAETDATVRAELLAGLQSRLRRLVELMHGGVADLRGFVSRLRAGGSHAGSFEAIVASYARRFAELTGIEVRVELQSAGELDTNDRLCAEVFQMIAEGLANVRRHSEGKLAIVRVAQAEQVLLVSIQNDGAPERAGAGFSPRSIADRARSLQGWTTVADVPEGGTLVTVGIPL